MERRDFLRGLAAGGAVGYIAAAGLSSTVLRKHFMPPEILGDKEIGALRSLKVKSISETSWFNNARLVKDIKDAGGLLVNQYEIPWTVKGVADGYEGNNAGGYSALIECEELDGKNHTFLLDTGWNTDWTDKRFGEEGVDRLLRDGKIEFLFISHEHFDHYWGIESTLKRNPHIKIYIPSTFYPEGKELLKGAEFPKAHLKNHHPHKGELVELKPGQVNPLFPGCAAITFDIPIITRVMGEEVLVFNVQDKGIVTMTGCCHMGIISLMEHVKKTIKGGEKSFGVFGGLHISPFEDWDPQYDDLVLALNKYGVQKLGCNHCTGYITAEKMVAANLPVVKGTARHKSKRDLYLGNGDELIFA